MWDRATLNIVLTTFYLCGVGEGKKIAWLMHTSSIQILSVEGTVYFNTVANRSHIRVWADWEFFLEKNVV